VNAAKKCNIKKKITYSSASRPSPRSALTGPPMCPRGQAHPPTDRHPRPHCQRQPRGPTAAIKSDAGASWRPLRALRGLPQLISTRAGAESGTSRRICPRLDMPLRRPRARFLTGEVIGTARNKPPDSNFINPRSTDKLINQPRNFSYYHHVNSARRDCIDKLIEKSLRRRRDSLQMNKVRIEEK
jgi:hypothetical protein